MNSLTPEKTGTSPLALKIAKRVLSQPAMRSLRKEFDKYLGGDGLRVFCSYLAREVIGKELCDFDQELFPSMCHRQTPAERGKQDGQIAKIGGNCFLQGGEAMDLVSQLIFESGGKEIELNLLRPLTICEVYNTLYALSGRRFFVSMSNGVARVNCLAAPGGEEKKSCRI